MNDSYHVWHHSQTANGGRHVIGYTACPRERKNDENNETKKWPDAIGIGVPKAGTGTLSFLDCHPDVAYRDHEPNMFMRNRVHYDLADYRLPLTSSYLIEKSPFYSRLLAAGDVRQRVRAIIGQKPRVKIFIFIRDPIKRLVSHFSMCKRELFSYCQDMAIDEFFDHVTYYITTNSTASSMPEFIREYVHYGNYGDIIDEVMDETDSIHIADGEMLKEDPLSEYSLLFDYFGLSVAPLEWRFNEEKGQHCLYRPVKFCLDAMKGHQPTVQLSRVRPNCKSIVTFVDQKPHVQKVTR